MKKPVVEPIKKGSKPIVQSSPPKNEWLFSFKEFKQIDDFGFSGMESGWFSSLFKQLSEISKLNPDLIQKNPTFQQNLRYHPINWNHRGMKIKRSDFNWVNKNVIENETEFIFYQFQISTALGRVIGYWEENFFNILLIDRMHNMQPSKYNDYKIRKSTPVDTDITALLFEVEKIKNLECNDACKIKKALTIMSNVKNEGNCVIFYLEEDFLIELKKLADTYSLSEILEKGIHNLM